MSNVCKINPTAETVRPLVCQRSSCRSFLKPSIKMRNPGRVFIFCRHNQGGLIKGRDAPRALLVYYRCICAACETTFRSYRCLADVRDRGREKKRRGTGGGGERNVHGIIFSFSLRLCFSRGTKNCCTTRRSTPDRFFWCMPAEGP